MSIVDLDALRALASSTLEALGADPAAVATNARDMAADPANAGRREALLELARVQTKMAIVGARPRRLAVVLLTAADALEAERKRCAALEAALVEALDEFEDTLPQLMDYHVKKYGYRETLARLRALLPSAHSAPPTPAEDGP